jgi:hypothetical protein
VISPASCVLLSNAIVLKKKEDTKYILLRIYQFHVKTIIELSNKIIIEQACTCYIFSIEFTLFNLQTFVKEYIISDNAE